MSAQFLQSYTPAENQTIRVNDAIIRGDTQCGKITLPALGIHQQLTSTSTNLGITGDAEQFVIQTFETSPGVGGDLVAGASVNFTVIHGGVVAGKTLVLVSKAGSYNGNFLLIVLSAPQLMVNLRLHAIISALQRL